MDYLAVTKILPKEKKIWVKNFTVEYYNQLIEDGWSIYWESDKRGKKPIVLKCIGDRPPPSGVEL